MSVDNVCGAELEARCRMQEVEAEIARLGLGRKAERQNSQSRDPSPKLFKWDFGRLFGKGQVTAAN